MIRRMTYELGQGTGPLRGVRVVEIAGIGPGPHACMLLADLDHPHAPQRPGPLPQLVRHAADHDTAAVRVATAVSWPARDPGAVLQLVA